MAGCPIVRISTAPSSGSTCPRTGRCARNSETCWLLFPFFRVQLPTQNHLHSPQAPLLLVIVFVKICLSSNLTTFSLLTCVCVYYRSGFNRTRGGFSNHKCKVHAFHISKVYILCTLYACSLRTLVCKLFAQHPSLQYDALSIVRQ